MLAENRTVGRSGKEFTDLASNSTLNNLRFIQRIMRERKPGRTLEIGFAFGASTLVFCSEHQRIGRSGTKQHTAIDPYQANPLFDEAGVLAIERAGLSDFLDYRREFSEFALPRLLEAREHYEFIYVDGSHLFENVLLDTLYGARLLNPGGIIAFDDSLDPHVAKALRFIRTNLNQALREIRGSQKVKSLVSSAFRRQQLTVFERIPSDEPVPADPLDTPLRPWNSKLGRF